ncbi:VanZ family protein [Bradyrhizobium sp. 17]|uniref:VanZ family protein n=1 Tax=Bradyrhizobium sp. 17 TaxID=2782649 RepID=UPI001FFA3B25|nr:VanZ family protein [Bradyrhizobium sp. 17]MCK1518857.1 VanZ family protein [Bradyrhizobium sp. 17]
MTRFYLIAGWLVLGAIAFVTLGPVHDRPQVAPPHLEHFAAFLVLGLVFSLAYPNRSIHAVTIAVGGAILLEGLQLLTPDRHGRLVDTMTKVAGAASGIMLARVALNSWRARLRSVPAVGNVFWRSEQDQH